MSRMVCHSIASVVSIDDMNQGGSNGSIVSGHILAPNIAPKPQAILHTQPVSDLNLGSVRYCNHENIGTEVSISDLSLWISMLIYTSARPPHIPYR